MSEIHNPKSPLPEGWRWVRLGEVCEFAYGSGLPERDRLGGLITVFGSNGVVGYHNVVITQGRTIIIGRKGSIGKVNFSESPCWPIDTTYYIDSSKTECDLIWLYWLLKWLKLDLLNKATGVPGLNREDAYSQLVPLPPIEEQHRIATKIQELMKEVERARTACEKQLEAAQSLPSAYLREVFESEEAKMWERRRLGEVCKIIMGQSPPGHTYNTECKGLPFYQGKIEFGKVYLKPPSTWCTQPQKIAEPNDILISVRAPVGPTNMCDIKCCIGRGLAALRPKSGIESLFVFYFLWLIEPEISEAGQGSTFSAISKSQIQNFEIPLPALPAQQHIASKLKEKMAEVEKLRTSIEKQLEAINALPQVILRKAFRGELGDHKNEN